MNWTRGFEIFWIDHYASDTGKKNIAGTQWKYLYQCHPPYTIGSVHTGCYFYNSLVHMIYILFTSMYL